MKKVTTVLIVVVVLGAGVFYFVNQYRSRSKIIPQRPAGVLPVAQTTVIYTDEGYTPKELKIKLNTEVVFRNSSSFPMWTASDVHPIHTILSSFDAKKNIPQGQSYSFTFTQKGTWPYHDHLRPQQAGKIIVE